MSPVRWLSLSIVMAAILVGVTQYRLLDGIQGELFALAVEDDTEYAPGYSDAGFRHIDQGMSTNEVTRVLGPPLSKAALEGDHETWRYSRSPHDGNYRIRAILFERGRVTRIVHEFYLD